MLAGPFKETGVGGGGHQDTVSHSFKLVQYLQAKQVNLPHSMVRLLVHPTNIKTKTLLTNKHSSLFCPNIGGE